MAEGKDGAGKVLLVLAVILGVAWLAGREKSPAPSPTALAATAAATPACSVQNISVSLGKHGFVDECRRSSCPVFKGVATVTNGCSEPIGVQLKATAMDGSGNPVATKDFWPESTRNLAPGDTIVTLDHSVAFEESIDRVQLSVIDVRRW